MKDVFISHSSKDKTAVRKLVDELIEAGLSVWFDEQDIDLGQEFVSAIQDGIENSRFVAIWITTNALQSGWVEKEWVAKYSGEVGSGVIKVLPLLAENCADILPPLLKSKNYANFHSDYNAALEKLISTAKKRQHITAHRISSRTRSYLNYLRHSEISIPLRMPIRVLEQLKKLPRSGKKIRFIENDIPLPTRSVYDHIESTAHTADCLWEHVNHGISNSHASDVARLIAYHDVCEVLLGDVPAFTPLNHKRREIAQIVGQKRYGTLPDGMSSAKIFANDFIYMFLTDSARESMQAMDDILNDKTSPIYRYFMLVDKIDPIIAVWRYIHVFRREIKCYSGKFFETVEAFFDNPNVGAIAKDYREDQKIELMVSGLQDISNAHEYLHSRNPWKEAVFPATLGFSTDVIKSLVEGRDFVFPDDEIKRD